MRRSTIVIASIAAAGTLAVAGCSSSKKTATPSSAAASTSSASTSSSAAAPTTTAAASGTIKVLAAASLTEAFNTIGKQFEAQHAGSSVVFTFEASSAAALQITNGAKVDVFASASPKNMTQVKSSIGGSTNFVSNTMEIAIPPSNPGHVTSLADLAKKSVKVALCQAQVPCGVTAAKVFANAKLTVKPVTLEPDVKSTLAKVELKSVDAGIVYVSDVHAAGTKVKGIVIPANLNATTEYPIATLTKAPNPTLAKAFVAYVLSPAGQQVLQSEGFAKP
jgi:molybdate transport system substrate-binding protein